MLRHDLSLCNTNARYQIIMAQKEDKFKSFKGCELPYDLGEITDNQFVLLPKGTYLYKVKGIDLSKENGPSGHRSVRISLEVADTRLKGQERAEALGGTTFDYLSLSPDAAWKMKRFADAAAGHAVEGKKFRVVDYVGKMIMAQVNVEDWDGEDGETKQSNKVVRYYAAASWQGQNVSDAEVADDLDGLDSLEDTGSSKGDDVSDDDDLGDIDGLDDLG